MIWNRSIRVSSTIGLTLALALGALAAPAFVAAKPAPLEFGVGPGFDTAKTTGAMPLMVSPGSTVAFEVWARNKGGSNIAKLFLTARTDAAFDGFILTNTGNTKGSCSGGPGGGVALRCSWKPFKPGATTRVLLILTAPASGDSLPVNFEWSSSGFVAATTTVTATCSPRTTARRSTATSTFAGRWIKPGSENLVVETNPDLSEATRSRPGHAPKEGSR